MSSARLQLLIRPYFAGETGKIVLDYFQGAAVSSLVPVPVVVGVDLANTLVDSATDARAEFVEGIEFGDGDGGGGGVVKTLVGGCIYRTTD